jgi:hypothetical protein
MVHGPQGVLLLLVLPGAGRVVGQCSKPAYCWVPARKAVDNIHPVLQVEVVDCRLPVGKEAPAGRREQQTRRPQECKCASDVTVKVL